MMSAVNREEEFQYLRKAISSGQLTREERMRRAEDLLDEFERGTDERKYLESIIKRAEEALNPPSD